MKFQSISFISNLYLSISIYCLRCYFFCVLTFVLLSFYKKNISLFKEFLIFIPVIASGIFILSGIQFDDLFLYWRILGIVQVLILIALFIKIILNIYLIQKKSTSALKTHYNLQKLSSREISVALLLFEGKKTEEIAEQLFISTATVKTHIQHIFEKYDVHNRIELINKTSKNHTFG